MKRTGVVVIGKVPLKVAEVEDDRVVVRRGERNTEREHGRRDTGEREVEQGSGRRAGRKKNEEEEEEEEEVVV